VANFATCDAARGIIRNMSLLANVLLLKKQGGDYEGSCEDAFCDGSFELGRCWSERPGEYGGSKSA
jgi:hypothetical protein